MTRIPFSETENLDIFMQGIFSEDCYLTDLDNTVIDCIYNETYGFIGALTQDVQGTIIIIKLRNTDIKQYNIKKKTNLTIRNQALRVKEVRYDSNGLSDVELEKITK